VTVPGEEDEEGKPLWRSALPVIGQPHTIVVNRQGKRFGDEAFYRSFYYKIDEIDGGTQTHPNFPCWVVIDSQVLEKYPFFSVTPGQEFPEGFGTKADTLPELAQLIGIDAAALKDTVERFNAGAEQGQDPDFGRGSHPWSAWMCGDVHHKPNPNLGAIKKGPFYAVELRRMGGTGIASAGLMVDEHARVVSWMGQPIPGLYAAGNSTARMETGAVMQSGISNARGMTQGWLAAKEACGSPSDLLERNVERMGI
jgi:3-oxosteroid 1-dehydrogenase